jgi:hypothetical protein
LTGKLSRHPLSFGSHNLPGGGEFFGAGAETGIEYIMVLSPGATSLLARPMLGKVSDRMGRGGFGCVLHVSPSL